MSAALVVHDSGSDNVPRGKPLIMRILQGWRRQMRPPSPIIHSHHEKQSGAHDSRGAKATSNAVVSRV